MPGNLDPERRLPWIDYDSLLDAGQGNVGGSDPSAAYRHYVESGMNRPSLSPFEHAIDGWILGSTQFAERVRALISPNNGRPAAKRARRRKNLTAAQILQTVCEVLELDRSAISVCGSRHPARAIFAYLAHRHTDATLRQLAEFLGLSRPDSVPSQLHRVTRASGDSEIRRQLARIEAALELPSRIPAH